MDISELRAVPGPKVPPIREFLYAIVHLNVVLLTYHPGSSVYHISSSSLCLCLVHAVEQTVGITEISKI